MDVVLRPSTRIPHYSLFSVCLSVSPGRAYSSRVEDNKKLKFVSRVLAAVTRSAILRSSSQGLEVASIELKHELSRANVLLSKTLCIVIEVLCY